MNTFAQDLRYAVRQLVKSPGFTVLAVLSLALAIGACSVVFSLANALLVRIMPFPNPGQLVSVESVHPKQRSASAGPADFRDWRMQNTVFERMAYASFVSLNLTGQSFSGFAEPELLTGTQVSDDFFPLLGVAPALGRWLKAEDKETRVVLLSHRLWLRRFGARPDVVGQTLTMNGCGYTVVGVMPANFRFNMLYVPQFWVPVEREPQGRGVHQVQAFARLKPGVTMAAAQTQMDAIAKRLEKAYPASNTGWGVRVINFEDVARREFGSVLLIFSATVLIVLLIACANVANMQLARAASRAKELVARRAFGASRFAIARLLLVENVLLALSGAGLGLVLALWITDVAASVTPEWLDLRAIMKIDRDVILFTLLLSLTTGVLAGLAPALRACQSGLNDVLKQGGGAASLAVAPGRAIQTFVVAEFVLVVLLLVTAGLLTKSFLRLLDVDPGFRRADILSVRMQLPVYRYREPERMAGFCRELLTRVRQLPGVTSAGVTFAIPMGGAYSGGGIEIEGRPPERDWTTLHAAFQLVTPGYLETLGVPLKKGRYITDADRKGTPPVILINEELARRFFPGVDPIGKKIRASESYWQTVVGVVGDVRHSTPERRPEPETYSAFDQSPVPWMFLAVRTAVPPLSLSNAVRAVVRTMDRDVPLSDVRSMEQAIAERISPRKYLMFLTVILGVLALALASLGLAGVVWYDVSRRTREIGIRMALGARPGIVLWSVVRRGAMLCATGLAIGLGAAFVLSRFLASLLFGVAPSDPSVFILVPLLLGAVALIACYVPARRAVRVDPVIALRYE